MITDKNSENILDEVKELVTSKGYIYALCMIIFEDFHVKVEKMQEIDYRKRLNTNETSLLLGFLIQDKINFSTPDSPQNLIQLKQKTYVLMEELQQSLIFPFIDKLKKNLDFEFKEENFRADQKDFFGSGDMLTEPIFYSGTGVYDFQYLEFVKRKYKYDQKWLTEKKLFDLNEVQNTVSQIKKILQEKSAKVQLFDLKENLPAKIDEFNKKYPHENWGKHVNDFLPMMELYQYNELFFDHLKDEEELSIEEIREKVWKSFYKNLIDLFVIKKSDFREDVNIEAFLVNFSIVPKNGSNSQFKTIGDYNMINSHPIISLDDTRYFIPDSFLLFKSIYESPFYWMTNDHNYINQASMNRGKVGEEIAYDFLSSVFGTNKTYKSVKVRTKKGRDDTDIDVLCILGSKTLSVQVKSKKLTELSRKGDDEALKNDFHGAVQDAYRQGLVSRQKTLEKEAKFIDESGNDIALSEEIDDVYIMVITTEDYPSLTHQAHVMLEKKDNDPFPIVLTIFELELLIYYLNDPYDFLYYIKQRISLMDYFVAEEEMTYLGYHLNQKLWKIPNKDRIFIESSFAQTIDRNYYPIKAGLEISDEGDSIKKRWKNENFNQLCNELTNLNEPKITDIIFHLYDWSGEGRENLVNSINSTKQKTLNDGKIHNISLLPDDSCSLRVGATYFSLNTDDSEELTKQLLTLCQARKYKSKGDVWIGFGGLRNSLNMIDMVVFNNDKWEYDEDMENLINNLFGAKGQGRLINLGKKIGRNERCPCGSGIKYKKCCG